MPVPERMAPLPPDHSQVTVWAAAPRAKLRLGVSALMLLPAKQYCARAMGWPLTTRTEPAPRLRNTPCRLTRAPPANRASCAPAASAASPRISTCSPRSVTTLSSLRQQGVAVRDLWRVRPGAAAAAVAWREAAGWGVPSGPHSLLWFLCVRLVQREQRGLACGGGGSGCVDTCVCGLCSAALDLTF